VLIVPGIVALWPVVLRKVLAPRAADADRGADALRRGHRLAIVLLAMLGPLLFAVALMWRTP
jgi:hypothetical protein